MTALSKKATRITVAALAVFIVLAGISLMVLQSGRFADFARTKLIAAIEDSTGARVEVQSLQIHPGLLAVVIRDVVIHGTEAPLAAPLAKVESVYLRAQLFGSLRKPFAIAELRIDSPRINILMNPDGTTNIPMPKTPSSPNSRSSLATVVDLAVGSFRLNQGMIDYNQRSIPLNIQGSNAHVLLDYNYLAASYKGFVKVADLEVASGTNPPLALNVNIPLEIRRDGMRVAGAEFNTSHSRISLSASLDHPAQPIIAVSANAKVSVPELAHTFGVPIAVTDAKSYPVVTLDVDSQFNQQTNVILVRRLNVTLGKTVLTAEGKADPSTHEVIHFSGNAALAELSELFKLSSPRMSGNLALQGTAVLDKQHNYLIEGTINSSELSISQGATRLSNVALSTQLQFRPGFIGLDDIRLGLLGGAITGNMTVQDLRGFHAKGETHGISLRTLSAALGQPINYGSELSGTFSAETEQANSVTAHARLRFNPLHSGIPVKGLIEADYRGAAQSLSVSKGQFTLPMSQVSIVGSINKSLDVELTSRDLHDFLPIYQLANHSASTLPISLQAGKAVLSASLRGDLANPTMSGQAQLTDFVAQSRLFNDLSLEFAASPSGVSISNGTLRRNAMQARFDGVLKFAKWHATDRSPVSTNVTIRNADLGDLVALANAPASETAGSLQSDIHITGTYGNPVGAANLYVGAGMANGQPFDRVQANVTFADRSIVLNKLEADAAGGHVTVDGVYRHPLESLSSGHTEIHLRANGIDLSKLPSLQINQGGVQGNVTSSIDVSADLSDKAQSDRLKLVTVDGSLAATNLRVRNQDAGSLTTSARTLLGIVTYSLRSNFAGSNIDINGRTSLGSGHESNVRAVIQNLQVEKALILAGASDIPVAGLLSANAEMNGTVSSPNGTVDLQFTNGQVYDEPVNRVSAKAHYTSALIDLPAFTLILPAGTVNLNGKYTHANGPKRPGNLQIHIDSSNIEASKIRHLKLLEPGIAGTLRISADVATSVNDQSTHPQFQPSNINADLSATALQIDKHNVGDLTMSARTNQSSVAFRLDSNLAQSEVHVSGTTRLNGDYLTRASATVKNLRYQNLLPFLSAQSQTALPADALIEGQAQINGSPLDTKSLEGELQLNRLEVISNTQRVGSRQEVRIHNNGPLRVTLSKQVVQLQKFSLRGPKMSLDATGAIDLTNAANPLRLNATGNLDLGLLQDLDREFYSSGALALSTNVAGSLSQPSLNGQLSLKDANVNYADAPNGLSGANGVILLSGTTAVIKKLTAESGGGRIDVSGSVGLSPRAVVYNLQGKAARVRIRYGSASITSSATVALTGNSRRGLLSGKVVVERIAYSSSSDIGSLLSNASTPPVTSSTTSPLLSAVRLDIDITTASDLRVETSYVEKLELNSRLRVRGSIAEPGLVGHVNIVDGQLVFFGNTYNVNNGSINFYDANNITPILNLSLQTVAQGVDVTLGVTGPVSNMKLSYRSDPPLTFEQIVQLLATNTTPFDPTIAAHQPTSPTQSVTQMGESQVLGQAIANPLASRVQRVFGLTQFKIDPTIAGNNGQPTARVTLRQKITNSLTFTYITDVTQTNSEIVRVQWDLNSRASAVALRDYNGNVSVQLFYKFQVR